MLKRRHLVINVLTTTLAVTVLSYTAIAAPENSPSLSISNGEKIWNQKFTVKSDTRSCTSCHTSNPQLQGKHIRTGKDIKPMAPSINPDRFTDTKKTAKWFKRNCKWTIGRECSVEEKADITNYLKSI